MKIRLGSNHMMRLPEIGLFLKNIAPEALIRHRHPHAFTKAVNDMANDAL